MTSAVDRRCWLGEAHGTAKPTLPPNGGKSVHRLYPRARARVDGFEWRARRSCFPARAVRPRTCATRSRGSRPDLLSLAEEVVGEDPFPRAEEGTKFAQPAIFCASLAGWAALGGPDGDFMAGHSLGELGALVAAGCLRRARRARAGGAPRQADAGGGRARRRRRHARAARGGRRGSRRRARRGARPGGRQRQLAPADRPLGRAQRASRGGRGRRRARAARDGAAGHGRVSLADDGECRAGVRRGARAGRVRRAAGHRPLRGDRRSRSTTSARAWPTD